MKNVLKEDKAITLVALVVTIVVIIILAGISIKLSIGEDGLIDNTKQIKEDSEAKVEREKLDIEKQNAKLYNSGKITVNNYLEYLKLKEKIEQENIEVLEDGTTHITIQGKYVFLIEKFGDNDLKIVYTGPVQNK